MASAVRELAYVPNQLASAPASARTRTIGVVVPSLTNGVFADYLKALHDVFLPAGLRIGRYVGGCRPDARLRPGGRGAHA